jgi:hypothetical protein
VYVCFFALLFVALAAFGFARSTFLAVFDRSTLFAVCDFAGDGAACSVAAFTSPHTFVLSFHFIPALLQSALVSGCTEVSAATTSGAAA